MSRPKSKFSKTEHTDLARYRSGHNPALRRWQQLLGVSEHALCRLCGEEVQSAEHLWLQCPALMVERHHRDLGNAMDELVRLPQVALALLRNLLRRLR